MILVTELGESVTFICGDIVASLQATIIAFLITLFINDLNVWLRNHCMILLKRTLDRILNSLLLPGAITIVMVVVTILKTDHLVRAH